ncbi:MAG: AMP-binding protein [Alphaproteobacteria bacterium]|nr:AMP-binding protein [Alphaproteobacteria bacterium]
MNANWSLKDLYDALADGAGRPALLEIAEDGVRPVSAADLHHTAGRLAAGLRAEGLAPGEPAAIVAENSADWITCWLGLVWAGAVVVGLDDLASDEELARDIADCGCRFVFAGTNHMDAIGGIAADGGPSILVIGEGAPPSARPWRHLLAAEPAPERRFEADDPVVMVYTSGTTGKPKRFTLSGANIAANVGAILETAILRAGDRILLPLPLHHIYPLVVGVLTPLASGAAVVLPAAVSGREIVRAMSLTKPRVMIGVPRLYDALVAGIEGPIRGRGRLAGGLLDALVRLSCGIKQAAGVNLGRWLFRPLHRRLGGHLRILVSGGARLQPETAGRLEGLGFDVLSGYGLAETASLFTGNLPGNQRIGKEGMPLAAGSTIRIAGKDAEGTGEIQLKGTNVFAGYDDNPEANAAAFTDDGWFRTGDLGRLDEDGHLSVSGRSKEIIVLGGGKNVNPEELERHYGQNPAIAEIAVLEEDGRLVALVKPDIAVLRDEAKTHVEDALRMALADASRTLAPFQRVSGFAIARETLPRTRLGKYRRFLLPAIYERASKGIAPRAEERPSEDDLSLLADPVAAKVWDWLKMRYQARRPTLDSSPQLDLAMDSLEWMTVAFELESRFGVHVDEEVYSRIDSVRDLLRETAAAAGAGAAAPPATALPRDWIAPRGPVLLAAAIALYAFNWLLMRLVFRLSVRGRENLPRSGGAALVAPNHASDIDPGFIMAAVPLSTARRFWWGGDVMRLFTTAVGRIFSRIGNVFPVDERRPQDSLKRAGAVLDRGDILGWFPESWRTPDGTLQRFLPGIGHVLAGREMLVVPTYIAGSFAAFPRTARWPRPHPVRVIFGPAVGPGVLAAEGQGESEAERIADGLRGRVAMLEAEFKASGEAK